MKAINEITIEEYANKDYIVNNLKVTFDTKDDKLNSTLKSESSPSKVDQGKRTCFGTPRETDPRQSNCKKIYFIIKLGTNSLKYETPKVSCIK